MIGEQPVGRGSLPHVLVVDDDTRLRELLHKYLSENGFRVTMAADAAEARKTLASMTFDLLILDVMMPGESGLDLTAALRMKTDVPILILTAMGDTEHRIAGLEQGADDYLGKPFEPRELLLRARTILRRALPQQVGEIGIVHLGECRFNAERGELFRADQRVRLTEAEARLLTALAARPGATLSRDDLSREGRIDAGGRSVDVQVTRLRRKIERNPKEPRYLRTIRGKGYTLLPD